MSHVEIIIGLILFFGGGIGAWIFYDEEKVKLKSPEFYTIFIFLLILSLIGLGLIVKGISSLPK